MDLKESLADESGAVLSSVDENNLISGHRVTVGKLRPTTLLATIDLGTFLARAVRAMHTIGRRLDILLLTFDKQVERKCALQILKGVGCLL
mmetsp:Transcript_29207/g.43078  ORF Transcript_29207/g.43078 Transcript_29207/m.43078 type:complete len:91 (+) Transcript_29207:2031-2303(+)